MLIIYICILLGLLIVVLLALGWRLTSLLLYARRQPLTRAPGDYGLAYEEVAFHSSDGLSLKGWWIQAGPSSSQEGQAPAVILVHPMFGNRHGFRPMPRAWPHLQRMEVELLKLAGGLHQAGYSMLLYDLRNHGESQAGRCAGGLSEDQDVVGAVDYVFNRLGGQAYKQPPQVGIVGFGMGAAAAIAALGREKGGAETIRVFSGDSEGGVGYIEIQPANVKKLRFLVAILPATLGALLRGYLRQRFGPPGLVLVPVVDRLFRWRCGYPLGSDLLLKFAREVRAPVLFVQAGPGVPNGQKANEPGSGEVEKLFEAAPGPKEIWQIEAPLGRLEAFAYVCNHPEPVLYFLEQQVGLQGDGPQ